MDAIVTEEQLLKATGYDHPGRLAQCLKRQGIRYFRGNHGGIRTTVEELNAVLRADERKHTDRIDFE